MYIAACVELEEFFRRHRGDLAAPKNEAGYIVLWTLPRSYRTFRVVVLLCKAGFAQQAAMLNRTLFEDMLAARNGGRRWTGKSVPQMLRAVAPMWNEGDRRLLMQMHDIAHAANNTLLHHSAASLSRGVRVTNGVTFDVGPSPHMVAGALGLAFWTFANTISLALQGEQLTELSELVTRHKDIYSSTRTLRPDEEGP